MFKSEGQLNALFDDNRINASKTSFNEPVDVFLVHTFRVFTMQYVETDKTKYCRQ